MMTETPNSISVTPTSDVPKSTTSLLKRDLILVGLWVGLSVVGQFALFFASGPLMIFLVIARDSLMLILIFMAIAWAAMGAFVGFFQSLILQKYFPHLKQWILFTIMGWTLSGEIVGLFMETARGGYTTVRLSVAGAIVGLLIGIMQWVVLRGNVRKAYLWILASVLGGAIGGVGGFPIVGFFLIVIGIITGPLLVWFLRHPIQKNKRSKSVSTVSS
jgi:hypothetical protein